MKKVLHLNYGGPTIEGEPDGDSIKYFEIETFRLVHGNIFITPKGGEISKDEISLTMISGHCYYDGIYYSDVWVETLDEIDSSDLEDYDVEKSILSKEIVRKHKLSSLIYQLDIINSGGWDTGSMDGETMQHVIEKLNMDEQMLRQLIMTFPSDNTKALLEEKAELERQEKKRQERVAAIKSLSKEELVNRLSFIQDDVLKVIPLLEKTGVDMEFSDGDAGVINYLSNIQVASDPKETDPEKEWTTPLK